MTTNAIQAAGPLGTAADNPPRPLGEIVAVALAVGCTIPACAAGPGTPCDDDGAVHLARLSLACRSRYVSGPEFSAVILTVPAVFRPATLIRPAVSR